MPAPPTRQQVQATFYGLVNMSANALARWLETDESLKVGFRRPGETESVGHAAGRHIVRILQSSPDDLDHEDIALMRKATGFIKRLRAQEPENTVTSRWRYALMNWGYDPLI